MFKKLSKMGSSPLKLKTELEQKLYEKFQLTKKDADQLKCENQKLHEMLLELTNKIKQLEENCTLNAGAKATCEQKPDCESFETDDEQLEYDTNLNPSTEWIRVRNRRQSKKRKMDKSLSPVIDDSDVRPKERNSKPHAEAEPKKVPQPPPIVVDKIDNYEILHNLIKSKVQPENFNIKLLHNNSVKINLKSGEDHRLITKTLNEEKYQWFSFENKQERPLRVMVKNLHHSCKPESIINDLKENGFKITDAVNKIGWFSKKPLDMFVLSFQAEQEVKAVMELRYILNTKIEIQDLKKNKLLVQCKKCQSFGHTQNFCGRDARCVKCAGTHDTKGCQKTAPEKAKCCHCGEAHPASYRGCVIAKELQRIKTQSEAKTKKTYAQITVEKKLKPIVKNLNKQSESAKENQEIGIKESLQLILSRLDNFDARLKCLEISTKGAIPKSKISNA